MSDPIVITRELVKRGWSDFEPKLITGLLTGSVAAFVVSILSQYGVHLSAIQENYIAIACFFIGGYLTPSTGTAVTKRIDSGVREVEQHSGNSVTVVTAPTKIQRPENIERTRVIPDSDVSSAAEALQNMRVQQTSPGVFTKVIEGTEDSKPTEVLPPYSRSQSIMDAIQSRSQS